MDINTPNIPDEELSFESLSVDDIVSQNTNLTDEDNNTNDDSNELLDVVSDTVGNFDDYNNTNTDDDELEDDNNVANENEEEPASTTYNEDAYAAALELARENNLLIIPDDIEGEMTADTWEEILAENRRLQHENALNEVRDRAGDGYVASLFDYAYNGATWDDIQNMQNTIQNEINVENLDVKDEDHQRYLIEEFLTDGLNPENPAHKIRLSKIEQEVDGYFERLEAEEIASKAKEFFKERFAEERDLLYQQQQQQQLIQQQEEAVRRQQQQEWVEDFRDTLESRKWSRDKKDAVVSQFDIVELDNGQQMELWKYKWNNLWKSPEMVHVLMDFLADIDPFSMQFKNKSASVNKQVSSKIQDLINKKSQKRSNGRHVSHKRAADQNKPKTIDPRKLI